MRSSPSMNWVRQLSSVVLPDPVPPETMVLTRQRPITLRISPPSGVMVPTPVTLPDEIRDAGDVAPDLAGAVELLLGAA